MFKKRPATLIYLDPPYNIERKQRYNIDVDDDNFHIELLTKCIESESMIMISGYDNDLYNSLLTEEIGWTRSKSLLQLETRPEKTIQGQKSFGEINHAN